MNLTNNTAYSTSRLDLFAKKLLDISNTSELDYLIVEPYSIGDIFHTLSLVNAFRQLNCREHQRINLICNSRCLPITKMFNNVDHAIGIDNISVWEFHLEAIAERYGPLSLSRPIVMAPDMYSRGWLGRSGIFGIEAKKLILELPYDAVPHIPKLDLKHMCGLINEFKTQGLDNNSVIIFNHANTIKEVHQDCFKSLIEIYGDRVYYDATLPGKGIIPWAKPLKMDIADVPYYAQYAGTVVNIRSGITDILSMSSIKLVTLYPNSSMLYDWQGEKSRVVLNTRKNTLYNNGLTGVAHEHVIFCDEMDSTESISLKIKDTLLST